MNFTRGISEHMPLHILYVWNGDKHSTTFFCVVNSRIILKLQCYNMLNTSTLYSRNHSFFLIGGTYIIVSINI